MRITLRAARVILPFALSIAWAQAGTITLPPGTQLRVVLEKTLSTKNSKTGDPFSSRLVMPVFLNEREVLPLGTMVEGTVAALRGPGRVNSRAEIQLRPEKLILPDGRDYSLSATLESAKTGEDTMLDPKEGTIKGPGKDGIDKRSTAGGAVLGAAVGAGMGGGTGAAMGAAAVGAVVLLHQIFKKGKNADVPAGSELVLEVARPVSFSDMQEVPPGTITEQPERKLGEQQ